MQNNNNKSRLLYLDILRITACLLVAYTHLVYCAMKSTMLADVSINANLPLLSENFLCGFENFLQTYLNSNPASIGVALFFLITGYLMPMMLERYNRLQFLINRILRIFPTMIVATLIIGIFLHYSQHISFTASEYINSWFLTSYLSGTRMITGVLWTLVVEILFYLICFAVGRFNVKKFILLELVLLGLILCGQWHVLWCCKFLVCILLGSAIYLSEKCSKNGNKILLLAFALGMYIAAFRLGAHFEHAQNLHYKISTHLIVFSLFIIVRYVVNKLKFVDKFMPQIKNLSNLVYPIYLVHCSIGLALIENLRHITRLGIYPTVVAVIICISLILHKYVEEPSIKLAKSINSKL